MENQQTMGGRLPSLGVGTMLWTPKTETEKEELFSVYQYCLDRGYDLFDTAEIYGDGASESLLGEFLRRDGRPARVSSKFAPPSSMNPLAPRRKTVSSDSPEVIWEALDGSLSRLGVSSLELYFMHTPPKRHGVKAYMDVMAQAVELGKVRGVGVCNFSAKQIDEAAEALEAHGLALSAAMAGYNVVRRYPEDNGVFDACKRHGVTLIPYAPLAEGVLTGKYRNKRMPLGYSTACYFGHLNLTKEQVCAEPLAKRLLTRPRECDRKRMEPVLAQMEAIGRDHEKSLAQVAINWLLTTPGIDVLPIPGIRTVKQAADNIGAVEWRMSAEERQLICAAEEQGRAAGFSGARRA